MQNKIKLDIIILFGECFVNKTRTKANKWQKGAKKKKINTIDDTTPPCSGMKEHGDKKKQKKTQPTTQPTIFGHQRPAGIQTWDADDVSQIFEKTQDQN